MSELDDRARRQGCTPPSADYRGGPPLAKGLDVDLFGALHHRLIAEFRPETVLPGLSEIATPLRILKQAQNRTGQRLGVTRRHKEPFTTMPYLLRDAAHLRGH